jgi:HSP20 family protein
MNLVRWQSRDGNLVRTTPHHDHHVFDHEINQLFDWALANSQGRCSHSLFPAMDVVEEDNQYVVRADLPGMTREDVEITYQDGILTLQGEKKSTHPEKNADDNGHRAYRERYEGKFGRNLRLSEKVAVERIEAHFKDGVLELILPFRAESLPRKIEIKQQ